PKLIQLAPQLRQSSMASAQPMFNGSTLIIMRSVIVGEIAMRMGASCALWLVGALMLAVLPAFAQTSEESAPTNNDGPVTETPLTPEESTILGNALLFDP